MPIEGVTVTKIIEPQQLGVYHDKIIYNLLPPNPPIDNTTTSQPIINNSTDN